MSAPYYQDDQVTLYHGDCREITAWLTADVLVTDPPYGMAFQSRMRKGPKLARIAGDEDTSVRDAVAALWGTDRPALMFGRWSVPAPVGERQRLIWHKASTPGMGDLTLPWGPNFEDIHLLGQGWDREATGLPRVGAVITTTQGRGGGCRRGGCDWASDAEAGGAHGESHRAVPRWRRGGPVRGVGCHAARCPESRAAVDRRRAGGALLRDHRHPVVRAGAGPLGR